MAKQPVLRKVQVATGVTLRYLEQGDPSGTAVLLLHPWAESLRCFDRLIALLPPSLRVLSLDQRGHGGAEKPDSGYELRSFAADVEAFMQRILAPPCSLDRPAAAMSPNKWPWKAVAE